VGAGRTLGSGCCAVDHLVQAATVVAKVLPRHVRRHEVIEIMERLEAIGASAILETRITNCRL